MPRIVINQQLTIYYRDNNPSGSPAVLLLHGLGVTSDSWILQIPALAKAGFRVISPDIRGFGKSGYLDEHISIATLSKDVFHLINALDIAPVHLVGISLGGVINLQTVLDEPQAILSATFINAFAKLRPKRVRTWLYLAVRYLTLSLLGLPAQARIIGRSLFPAPDQQYLRQELYNQLITANPIAYRRTIRALARFDVRQRLSEIHTPILIITGEQDTTVPVETQTILANGILNSKHIIIPGAGHGVTVEKPDQVNNILLDFLRP